MKQLTPGELKTKENYETVMGFMKDELETLQDKLYEVCEHPYFYIIRDNIAEEVLNAIYLATKIIHDYENEAADWQTR